MARAIVWIEKTGMSLRELIGDSRQVGLGDSSARNLMATNAYAELKAALHLQLLERIDLDAINRLGAQRLKDELRLTTEALIQEKGLALNSAERRQIVQDIENEVLGFGPLEVLLADPSISDILVNGPQKIFVERAGVLEPSNVRFDNNAHLLKIIDKIVSRVGRRIDESSPMVDARLPDGSRVNAIIAPLALDGATLSIRKFSVRPLGMHDLVRNASTTPEISELLQSIVKGKLNVLVSGGTGSGKTTLLNALSASIPIEERVITIEDAAELRLQQPHVVRLETRPANIEGRGEVDQRALVKNALRMRPDRIILGEARGPEAFDMLQAMNTGHEGSMSTIHANTARDALARLENMIGMAGMPLSPKAMRQQIASAINVVVQIARLSDGTRKLISLTEITGMEGDMLSAQDIFVFQQQGVDKNGYVVGAYKATGVRPKFIERLRAHGVDVPDGIFDPSKVYTVKRAA
jgi:pilus assembly protein CpaF